MKKTRLIAIICVLVLMLSLFSCGKKRHKAKLYITCKANIPSPQAIQHSKPHSAGIDLFSAKIENSVGTVYVNKPAVGLP